MFNKLVERKETSSSLLLQLPVFPNWVARVTPLIQPQQRSWKCTDPSTSTVTENMNIEVFHSNGVLQLSLLSNDPITCSSIIWRGEMIRLMKRARLVGLKASHWHRKTKLFPWCIPALHQNWSFPDFSKAEYLLKTTEWHPWVLGGLWKPGVFQWVSNKDAPTQQLPPCLPTVPGQPPYQIQPTRSGVMSPVVLSSPCRPLSNPLVRKLSRKMEKKKPNLQWYHWKPTLSGFRQVCSILGKKMQHWWLQLCYTLVILQ